MCSAGPRLLIGPTISPWQRDTTNLVLSGILIRLCDLIEDGLEHRREHGVFNLVSAGLHVDRLVRGWKVPRCVVGRAKRLSRGWSCRKKKLKVKYTDAQKDRVSNLLQVFCYFRSTYEVLIDADEHLSTLLGPADLLAHLKALVDLVSPMGVSDQVLGLLANGQLAEAGDARQVEKEEWRHLRNHQTRTCWPWPKCCTRCHHDDPITRRALGVMCAWLQGAKRDLPEIPPEFILASKIKHGKALQQLLPAIPDDFLANGNQTDPSDHGKATRAARRQVSGSPWVDQWKDPWNSPGLCGCQAKSILLYPS